jgi:hypothetical protein
MRHFGPIGVLLQLLQANPELETPKSLAIDAIQDINAQLRNARTLMLLELGRQEPPMESSKILETVSTALPKPLLGMLTAASASLCYFSEIGLEPQQTVVPDYYFSQVCLFPEVTLRVRDASAFLEHANDANMLASTKGSLKRRIAREDYSAIAFLIRRGYWSLDFSMWDVDSPEDRFLKSLEAKKKSFKILGLEREHAFYVAAQQAVADRYIKEFLMIHDFGAFPWTAPPSVVLEKYGAPTLMRLWLLGCHFLHEGCKNERAHSMVKKVATDLMQSSADFDCLISNIPPNQREPFGSARQSVERLAAIEV